MAVDLRVTATLNYFMLHTLKCHTTRAQVFVTRHLQMYNYDQTHDNVTLKPKEAVLTEYIISMYTLPQTFKL
jgi:hypothetical protein